MDKQSRGAPLNQFALRIRRMSSLAGVPGRGLKPALRTLSPRDRVCTSSCTASAARWAAAAQAGSSGACGGCQQLHGRWRAAAARLAPGGAGDGGSGTGGQRRRRRRWAAAVQRWRAAAARAAVGGSGAGRQQRRGRGGWWQRRGRWQAAAAQAAGGSGAGDGGHGQAAAVLGARASNDAGEAGPWLEPWPRTPINEVVCWT